MILITDQFSLDSLKYVLIGLEECQVRVCVCSVCAPVYSVFVYISKRNTEIQ